MSLNTVFVLFLFGGWVFAKLFKSIKLPAVLGMVIWGVICSGFAKEKVPAVLWDLEPSLKSFALTVILLRAGLGLSRKTLKKTGVTALLMSIIPGVFEGTALTLAFHYLFDFNWATSGLTAFMIAAVSPAVIVPSMLSFKEKGIGQKKEVPTIVLAGASLDDIFAITIFSLFLSAAVGEESSFAASALALPKSVLLGVIPGALIGYVLTLFLRKKQNLIRATEKTLVLLTAAMLLVEIGDLLHSAALLGVMTVGYMLFERANVVALELSQKLNKVWVFAEIILFVFIGFSVDLSVALKAGGPGILLIITGLLFRSLGVIIATGFSNLNWRERLFCVIAYIPKATVQAALGSVALSHNLPEGELILALAVLSIVFTAPLGLIGIELLGPKLLKDS